MNFSILIQSIPNSLSVSRIAFTPVIIYFFLYPIQGIPYFSALLFLLASLTDFLDGYLARKFRVSTQLGAALDLLGDKVLVLFVLLTLLHTYDKSSLYLVGSLILFREILILVIRGVYGQEKTKVILVAKLKTSLQMFGLLFLLLNPSNIFEYSYILGNFLLWLSVIIGYLSLRKYVYQLKN